MANQKKQNRDENIQQRDESTQKPFHFADRLNEQIKKKGSAVCVGLDPRLNQIPDFIREKHFKKHKNSFTAAAESIIEFNKGIIDAVHNLYTPLGPILPSRAALASALEFRSSSQAIRTKFGTGMPVIEGLFRAMLTLFETTQRGRPR